MSDAQCRQIKQKISELTQLYKMGMQLSGEELFDTKSRLSDGLPKDMVGEAVRANEATKRRVGPYDYYTDAKSYRLFRTVVSRVHQCGQTIYGRIYLDEEQVQPYRQQDQDRQQYRQQDQDRQQRQDQLQRKWEDEEHELRCLFEERLKAMQIRQRKEGRVIF